ncbi:hypothetical protein Ccrd_015317 [Cynara cardunculus var. scolymus]|uniref:Protein kinase, catalytic domain-containing protein n=1 Tax=Cynara cardunculus var. scolymus TaxID=59895 RepID=A0A103YC37_CYNCS|nr:hypothetical protein Ccrd_015317 [Cynara cardunculus var. scolymus]
MKKSNWFKQISNSGKLERRLSLGEYKRAVSWSKYLVSSGGEIKAKGEEEEDIEWSADMSQLFIGNKFATGRHSRVYRGVYKQKDVAIKLISQPEEDGDLASMLEKQFTSEVVLLFRLQHPNIITNARPPLPGTCPSAFRQLIRRCWSSKPEKRLGFDEIVRILERYRACVEEDPNFLTWYEPGKGGGSLLGCLRKGKQH